jgi:hypothetical protein
VQSVALVAFVVLLVLLLAPDCNSRRSCIRSHSHNRHTRNQTYCTRNLPHIFCRRLVDWGKYETLQSSSPSSRCRGCRTNKRHGRCTLRRPLPQSSLHEEDSFDCERGKHDCHNIIKVKVDYMRDVGVSLFLCLFVLLHQMPLMTLK